MCRPGIFSNVRSGDARKMRQAGRNLVVSELQVGSFDEGSTIFQHCRGCGYRQAAVASGSCSPLTAWWVDLKRGYLNVEAASSRVWEEWE